jgi:4-alpha-glucanotransferase
MHIQRSSGILLHLTSLPGPQVHGRVADFGSGDFGSSAYHFVDWLVAAGQTLWQVLPLNPTGPGNSPYMSPSAFALDPYLIDLRDLVERGWLNAELLESSRAMLGTVNAHRIEHGPTRQLRTQMLRAAGEQFFAQGPSADTSYQAYCNANADWLDDYALFMAIDERWPQTDWTGWPSPLAQRIPEVLERMRRDWRADIDFWRFTQWIAHRQWSGIKRYANERGVRIIGDLPIFIAPHSVDVWAQPELFDLTPQLKPRAVAGVPPDYFSETGQLWGNPLYRWSRHAEDNYAWWTRRVKASLGSADIVRIDHFRGFAAYWEVAAQAVTAIDGHWRPGPGAALFESLVQSLGDLPIIAEDLGVITEDVTQLRRAFRLPGMKILQFAFGDDARNAYLPHNYEPQSVVYTGTHDNDTSLGWFAQASERERASAQTYLKSDGREIGWDLIHCASQSVAAMAIYPFQDVLGLGSEARMNQPGVADGCWGWRFTWDQVQDWQAQRLRAISLAHGRNG